MQNTSEYKNIMNMIKIRYFALKLPSPSSIAIDINNISHDIAGFTIIKWSFHLKKEKHEMQIFYMWGIECVSGAM